MTQSQPAASAPLGAGAGNQSIAPPLQGGQDPATGAAPSSPGRAAGPRDRTSFSREPFERRLTEWASRGLHLADPSPAGRRSLGEALVVLLAPTVALAVDLALPPVLERTPYLLFLCAVAVAAWYGGRRSGLLALGLSALESGALLIGSEPATSDHWIRLGVFVASALIVLLLTVTLRTAGGRAAAESRRATAASAKLLAVIDSVDHPIAVLDERSRLLLANRAVADFFGAADLAGAQAAVVGMATGETLRDGDGGPLGREAAPVRRAMHGLPASVPACRVRLPSGVERWAALQATPVEEAGGRPGAIVLAWRDTTAEHESAAARDAFMGVLAHELRTPITTIYGGAHLLATRGGRLDDAATHEIASDVLHEAGRLHRIAENLLVLSRVERGELRPAAEPILLEPLVRAVAAAEAERWPATRFEVLTECPRLSVSGEPGYVEQILRNLLANAAKYSPAGSTIRVTIGGGQDELTVRVVDQGPGIDPAEAERLFDLYYRSPATAGKAPGSGIGLYVCRRLIEAMDGRIWALPGRGGGAEFGFALRLIDDVEEA